MGRLLARAGGLAGRARDPRSDDQRHPRPRVLRLGRDGEPRRSPDRSALPLRGRRATTTSFHSLILVALVVISVAGEPWYAVIAAVGYTVVPGVRDDRQRQHLPRDRLWVLCRHLRGPGRTRCPRCPCGSGGCSTAWVVDHRSSRSPRRRCNKRSCAPMGRRRSPPSPTWHWLPAEPRPPPVPPTAPVAAPAMAGSVDRRRRPPSGRATRRGTVGVIGYRGGRDGDPCADQGWDRGP